MKTYKVSADIRPYLRRNLLRGCYSCRFFRDEKGVLRCKTNASSETFHKMIVFSRSDRDSEKYGIKYVPYNKINMELILNETPAYVVEKVAECYLQKEPTLYVKPALFLFRRGMERRQYGIVKIVIPGN